MKALSIHQPWATLIAIGAKRIETRAWAAPAWLEGELLAIHATRTVIWEVVTHGKLREPFRSALSQAGYEGLKQLPLGSVVAVCRFVKCKTTSDLLRTIDGQEEAFGDFSPGRYGWMLEVVKRLDPPIPATGHQGLWNWQDARTASELIREGVLA